MEHALTMTAVENDPDFLARVARRWVEALDQDGTEPSEESLRRLQGVFIRKPRHGLHHLEIFATTDQFEDLATVMNVAANPRLGAAANPALAPPATRRGCRLQTGRRQSGAAAGDDGRGRRPGRDRHGRGRLDHWTAEHGRRNSSTDRRRLRPPWLQDTCCGGRAPPADHGNHQLPGPAGRNTRRQRTPGQSIKGKQTPGQIGPTNTRRRRSRHRQLKGKSHGTATRQHLNSQHGRDRILVVHRPGHGVDRTQDRLRRRHHPGPARRRGQGSGHRPGLKGVSATHPQGHHGQGPGVFVPAMHHPRPWCEAHHVTYWSRGGSTGTDNGTLLCSHHHHLIHKEQWTIQMRSGIPWFIPPPHVDPGQTPRRNRYFRLD